MVVAKVKVRVLFNSSMLEERLENKSATKEEPNELFPSDTWPHVDYYVQYWNLTLSQSQALLELRDRLVDVTDLELNRPMNVVRYLRAQSYVPKKAEKMFRKMLQWRLDNKVDSYIMTKDYTPPKDLIANYPGAILKGTDLQGDPIFVSRTGVTDIAGLLEQHGHEAMVQYEIYRRESGMIGSWIPNWERQSGRPIRQITVIEDLHGLSSRIVLSPSVAAFYGQVMELDQNNYPDATKKIIVIRAPAVFCAAWAIAKRFFPPFVHEKMCFCGIHNYLDVLRNHVDLDVLPPCIYAEGTGDVVDGMARNLEGGMTTSSS